MILNTSSERVSAIDKYVADLSERLLGTSVPNPAWLPRTKLPQHEKLLIPELLTLQYRTLLLSRLLRRYSSKLPCIS